ncbi:MAG: hypothetical protein ABIH20_02030 [Candidatus Diapherotrites archaeon]
MPKRIKQKKLTRIEPVVEIQYKGGTKMRLNKQDAERFIDNMDAKVNRGRTLTTEEKGMITKLQRFLRS